MKKNKTRITIIIVWVLSAVLSFFAGMLYQWASTTEIKTTKDYGQIAKEENFDNIVEVPVSDVEAAAKKQVGGLTSQDAEKLCRDVLGEKAEENGFPISYSCISAVSANDKLYYVMHIAWLVDNTHWSYIGNCFASSDGREIYDGIALSGEYEISELLWKK